jgi:hypothetical protein
VYAAPSSKTPFRRVVPASCAEARRGLPGIARVRRIHARVSAATGAASPRATPAALAWESAARIAAFTPSSFSMWGSDQSRDALNRWKPPASGSRSAPG